MTAYYNEIDPFAAEWLRNLIGAGLIAAGNVDERSIKDVKADDLRGYKQCHFFAGIGGWSAALRLAEWPDERAVWTGSCPCQPFSEAGKQQGFGDERDLWPAWLDLICECRPAIVFGEQVASGDGVVWADRTGQNLEAADYAFGAVVLPATGVGAPHRRDRFYFVANAISSDPAGRLAHRRRRAIPASVARTWTLKHWNGGFSRYGRLADGLPGRVAKAIAGGFGNAIVPELAAEFVASASEAIASR